MRTIDRLRYQFGVPIEYDEIHRGYYLTQRDFSLVVAPLGLEELLALSLLSELASLVDDTSVRSGVASLWTRIAGGRSVLEIERVRERFSLEPLVVGRAGGVELLRLLMMCHKGQLARVRYHSPWRDRDVREYVGRFERVRFSGGIAYAKLVLGDGGHKVLNASFIARVEELPDGLVDDPRVPEEITHDELWYSGDGVWSGLSPEFIEVTIDAPQSRYYGAQVWQVDQEDRWEGDRLIRRFPSAVSAELATRILGLGRAVIAVKPEWVLEKFRRDAAHLSRLCSGDYTG
jgi:predicted DNA-binding transcriptional regulator YafY